MFKQSTTDRQLDLLSNFDNTLDEARRDILNDPDEWHNLFFKYITSAIDEGPYAILYHQNMGRPNAPIRILVAMLILKEGFGWSDKALYQGLYFNLMIMKALGLENLNDKVPAQSTYYLFKNLLYQHQISQGVDLIGETFKQLTREKANIFGTFGDRIRMDSKLIGSNIANCSRLQLVISCLQVFWKSLSDQQRKKLSQSRQDYLDELCKKKPNQIVYPLNESEKSDMILKLGSLLLQLKQFYDDSDSDHFHLLTRLLDDQYEIDRQKVILKKPSEVSANSLQSAHDSDAAYRNKNGQTVKGYSVNITETCNSTGPNLITDVQVEKATTSDNSFVTSAIEATKEVVDRVKEVSLDGAYQDEANRNFAEKNEVTLHFTGIQGPKGDFGFVSDESGLKVYQKSTGSLLDLVEYKPGKYKTRLASKTWRYFTHDQIESSLRRKAIEQLPPAIKNRRNNVEATLFQLCYYTRNNKTRYRGLYKTRSWAYCRSIWINLVRVKNYLKSLSAPIDVAFS